jgi:hypothetical protein
MEPKHIRRVVNCEIRTPKGPQGQKSPADVIGTAVMVGRIATGEIAKIPMRRLQAS